MLWYEAGLRSVAVLLAQGLPAETVNTSHDAIPGELTSLWTGVHKNQLCMGERKQYIFGLASFILVLASFLRAVDSVEACVGVGYYFFDSDEIDIDDAPLHRRSSLVCQTVVMSPGG